MPQSLELRANGLVALTCDSLSALRGALFRDLGPSAATYLQDAGFAGGAALHAAFSEWLALNGAPAPAAIPATDFAHYATTFFRDSGWGSLEMGTLDDAVATIDSADWSEADPLSGLEFPGCHITTGMLADFFGRVAGAPLAVMEVECRSMGADRCRFLLGSSDVMQRVYDLMADGTSYDAATTAAVAPSR